MIILPIIASELRTAARKGSTWWVRFCNAGFALLAVLWIVWIFQGTLRTPVTGYYLLKCISWIAFGLCIFTGAGKAADSISSEKREGTLGLLFLTNLKGFDIILGKFFSNSLRALLNLLGTIPIFSVAVLIGGISAMELLRVPLSLLNTLFLSISIGVFVSCFVIAQKTAMGLCAAIILFLIAGIPGLADVITEELNRPDWAESLMLLSPGYTLEMALGVNATMSQNRFWQALILQFGLGISFLLAASVSLPLLWQFKSISFRGIQWREWFREFSLGSPAAQVVRRENLLEQNPILWLNLRSRLAPWITPGVIFLIVVFSFWGAIYYELSRFPLLALVVMTVVILDVVMKIRVAAVASSRFCEDRLIGAHELLLSTPLTLREIFHGQWMAIRKCNLWIHFVVLTLGVILYFLLWKATGRQMGHIVLLPFLVAVSIGDFITIGWVAMWKGMRVSHPNHASGAALVRVVLVPWVLFGTIMSLLFQVEILRDFIDRTSPGSSIAVGAIIWGSSSLLAIASARRNLRENYRLAATDRFHFEEKINPWRKLRRLIFRP